MSRISRPWWALLLLLPFLAHAATLEEEISAIDTDLKAVAAHGPDFPEALNLHRMKALAYARAFQSDCEAHLAAAEAEARPYLENAYAELLPSYRAHRLSLEASLAWSRGQCAHSEEDLVKATEVARDKAIEGIGVASGKPVAAMAQQAIAGAAERFEIPGLQQAVQPQQHRQVDLPGGVLPGGQPQLPAGQPVGPQGLQPRLLQPRLDRWQQRIGLGQQQQRRQRQACGAAGFSRTLQQQQA
mgnify:CR=1 FL=1